MKSIISWFAKNNVAVNLLMFAIIASGIFSLFNKISLELFPSLEFDQVSISTTWSGASPEEVEKGITIRIEEGIKELEGVEEISSISLEGSSRVSATVSRGYDPKEVMDLIIIEMDSLRNLPSDAENPKISIRKRVRESISLVISGDVSDQDLRKLGESVKEKLLSHPQILQADFDSEQSFEISIEIEEQQLRKYGLTLQEISNIISAESIERSTGSLKTSSGEILITSRNIADTVAELEGLSLLVDNNGIKLTLKDIANINDGFAEESIISEFNGKKAIVIEVYSLQNQNILDVTDAVKEFIEDYRSRIPEGVNLEYWRDNSTVVSKRLNMLQNNAIQGGLLVILLLGFFLRLSVAFWVFLGLPISFLGTFFLMPYIGITLNLVSLFGFILVLGIVVDDAIVTGENIYIHLKRGNEDKLTSVIEGTYEVAVPVTFGVLTTVAAFLPLMFVDGVRGQLFAQIALVVIPILLISLIESKIILPAHLKHVNMTEPTGIFKYFTRFQLSFADWFQNFTNTRFRSFLILCLKNKYTTLTVFIGVIMIIVALVSSGWLKFVFFPRIESETARATMVLPVGTNPSITYSYTKQIAEAADELKKKYTDKNTGESVIRNILSVSGSGGGSYSSNIGRVIFEIAPPEDRTVKVTSNELVREWRQLVGSIPGAESINYRAETGRTSAPIEIRLIGGTDEHQAVAINKIKHELSNYPTVFDVVDTLSSGKQEMRLELLPTGKFLGVSLAELTKQVRDNFYGIESQRIKRGREDIPVVLRYPPQNRHSAENLYQMSIKLPSGDEIPFSELARIKSNYAPSSITRVDRQRVVDIEADLDKNNTNVVQLKKDLSKKVAEIVSSYPGMSFSLEGETKEQAESFNSMFVGLMFALLCIYGLLAIPLKSYMLPILIMSVIPYSVAGAILGHLITGFNLTMISLMGLLALIGVVINDSLVLISFVNNLKDNDKTLFDNLIDSCTRRFRPIFLTSVTTFGGLTPIMFEKSTQAQFLIPMAISLAYGVLFSTLATLIVIPIHYLIAEDIKKCIKKIRDFALR